MHINSYDDKDLEYAMMLLHYFLSIKMKKVSMHYQSQYFL